MAKKQKRQVSRGSIVENGSAPVASEKPATLSFRSSTAEFNPDYTFVKKDLRTIAILAVLFITALVVLSFIL